MMEDAFGRNDFDFDLSEFRVVWVGPIPYFIPSYLSIIQEKYLVASQLTLLLRNVSVDNVLKNWMESFDENRNGLTPNQRFTLLQDVFDFAKHEHRTQQSRLKGIKFDPETVSSLAVEATFLRLNSTVKSIHFHLKFGYCYESFALIRLFLEQLAYAYTASKVSSGEYEDFLSPTKSIGHLKKLIPDVGRIYGELSKLSHIDKSTVHKYIQVRDGTPMVVEHSIYYSLEAARIYLEILEYYNIVFEVTLINYLQKFSFISVKNGDVKIRIATNFKKKKDKLISKINRIISSS